MGAHALFSPSSAARWMQCAGSLALCQGIEDTSSEFADEGTAAHELASMAFTADVPADTFLGHVIQVGEREFTVDDDMASFVQTFLDNSAREAGIHECEIRVPLGGVLRTEDQFGTADRVAIDIDAETLVVRDLKYGRGVRVFAKENPQLMLYAAGAAVQYEPLCKFKHFKIVIDQPRLGHLDEWEFDRATLIAFVKEAVKAVEAAKKALAIEDPAELRTLLSPSEKACQWCPAQGKCPAYAQSVYDTTMADFEDVSEPKDLTLAMSDEDIAEAMRKVDWVKGWVKAVEAEAHSRAMSGAELPGWKLVVGRAGARAWGDEAEAEAILKKARFKIPEMYSMKLLSPTQAEKLVKKAKPRVWKRLEALVTRKDGAVHLAPADDPREAQPPVSADDFEDVSNG